MTVMGSAVLYFIGCGAVIVLTYFLVAMRFYNNLMGKEGYLSFTLPVTAGAHMASKIISGSVFMMLSYFVLAVSGGILTVGTELWSGAAFRFFDQLIDEIHMNNLFVFCLYVLKGLTGIIETVAVIYLSICIGQLVLKHRVLAAIGVYIGINMVLGIIAALGSTIIVNLLEDTYSSVLFYGISNTVTILCQCAVAAGSIIGGCCLIKYRLNLE